MSWFARRNIAKNPFVWCTYFVQVQISMHKHLHDFCQQWILISLRNLMDWFTIFFYAVALFTLFENNIIVSCIWRNTALEFIYKLMWKRQSQIYRKTYIDKVTAKVQRIHINSFSTTDILNIFSFLNSYLLGKHKVLNFKETCGDFVVLEWFIWISIK